jgi:inosine/xanthosine triphosphate pyrophosphatase family protein
MPRRLEGKLVIATHNAGKLAEVRELLAPYGVVAIAASELGLPEPDETGPSFIANAVIKARAAADSAIAERFSRTFGEMTGQEKHGIPADGSPALSHRARAFQSFARACLAER